MKVKITADSTCDLGPVLAERCGFTVIPLYVNVGGKTYRDGVDIQRDDMLAITEENGGIGNTTAVNLQDYLEIFTGLRAEYDAIVHFTISGDMSSCYQNACMAAEEVGGVYVVDSRNLSSGIGHLVMDACEMARAGTDAETIYREMIRRREKLDVSFVLTTLEYLRRGGRCSTVAAMGANLLRLHPCIVVSDGKMSVGKKYRGSMQSCLQSYVKDRLADVDTLDTRRIFITDSGFDEETRAMVEKTIAECAPFEEIIRTDAGCTVSCHCGPGCLGILFYRK